MQNQIGNLATSNTVRKNSFCDRIHREGEKDWVKYLEAMKEHYDIISLGRLVNKVFLSILYLQLLKT